MARKKSKPTKKTARKKTARSKKTPVKKQRVKKSARVTYSPLKKAPVNEFVIKKQPRKNAQGETVFTVQISRKRRTLKNFVKAVALTDFQKLVDLRRKRGPGMLKIHVFSEYRKKIRVRQFVYRFEKLTDTAVKEAFLDMTKEIFSGKMDYRAKKIWRNYVYSFKVRI